MSLLQVLERVKQHEPVTSDELADAIEDFCVELDNYIERLEEREMGAFTRKEPIVVGKDEEERKKLGWEPQESITIKAGACTEDIDAVAHADKTGRSTQVMLQRFIVSWQLYNDANMPVEVSPEAIALLDSKYVLPVVERVGNLMQVSATPAQLQNFTSAAMPQLSVK